MAGISSRIGTIAVAVQTGKGAAAANPTVKFELAAAPSVMPVKEIGRYSTTDAGRDQGPAYVSRFGVAGDFQVYAHPQGIGTLFRAALGANANSGAGPNYTHTITPADDLPYLTIWRMVGNVIFERFVDCKVGSLRLSGSAGSPLTLSLSVEGIRSTFEAADTALAALLNETDAGYLYPEAAGAILIDGAAQPLSSIEFEVNNNVSSYQADDYFPQDIDPGAREVTLSFSTRFTGATAFPDYRTFYYGSAAGTTQSTVITPRTFAVTFTRNANTSLKIDLPRITYAAIPVNPDPGGDPLEVEVSTSVEKPSGATPIVTVTVKDQNATV